MKKNVLSAPVTQCYHCGDDCSGKVITTDEKYFCCEGCKMVFEILNKHGMCDYYQLNMAPGQSQQLNNNKDKFIFLNDPSIQQSLVQFKDETQTHITFYLPQIHCSSCLWLLENLHKIRPEIYSGKVNFEKKEIDIIFDHTSFSLQQVAETLTLIGYEPYISLNDLSKKRPIIDRGKIFRLGVAGFCFANIMLLSFPEYLGIDTKEQDLQTFFRYLNLLLSLPVFFYSANEFYISAWQGIRQRFLNIDAPIVIAIWVTFGRSVYEVLSGSGSGYFDSMAGIVFFMLAGRVMQDKTHRQLSFERDYTSYFPIAVTKINDKTEAVVSLPHIQLDDTLLIHHQELIPADGILTRGKALIDYSFVTGESLPVVKEMGEIVYAGGRQTGGNIEILVIKEVAQSYLTKLWNRHEFTKQTTKHDSFVHGLSRWFTWGVLTIATISGVYWYLHDASRIWDAITAVLIVACPCALLLSHTFTNGNIIRRLSRNQLYLRNATVIESIATIDTIVFDKTGTLTTGIYQDVVYEGKHISKVLKRKIATLASQSVHPLSRGIVSWAGGSTRETIIAFEEIVGKGIEGIVDGDLITIGSPTYVTGATPFDTDGATVWLAVEGEFLGKFRLHNQYREKINVLMRQLRKRYQIAVVSGDNGTERAYLEKLIGQTDQILFKKDPAQKMDYIASLQRQGKKVMMIGDGLNDAGALAQADVGIAVTNAIGSFTPSSDAIIEAGNLPLLPKYFRLCQANRTIILTAFVVSVIYNVIGLVFAVQGVLSPIVAAILMPCSSISILLLTYGLSNLTASRLRLR